MLEVKNIQGQVYLEVGHGTTRNGKKGLVPIRPLPLPRQPRAPGDAIAVDRAGYQWCQTRGLIVIDTGEHGLVAILPIGMAQVSSVVMTAEQDRPLAKGDEISYFQFGGSDIVVVFEKKVDFIEPLTSLQNKHILMGQKIASFRD